MFDARPEPFFFTVTVLSLCGRRERAGVVLFVVGVDAAFL